MEKPYNQSHLQQYQLPWPPSMNKYWRNVHGRMVLSEAGREYKRSIAGHLLHAGYRPFGLARIGMFILARPPDNRNRDLDNLHKGILDALQYSGFFEDDSQVDDLHIVRGMKTPGGIIDLQIWGIEQIDA